MKRFDTNNPTSQAINGALKLLVVASVIPIGLLAPNSLQLLDKLFGKRNKNGPKYLSSMKYQKLVTIEETDQGLVVRATGKGKKRALFASAAEVTIKTPVSWDGKWRLVMFDIPETRRSDRKIFAEKLSELNFLMIQKSCWVYPFECRKEIGLLIEAFDLEKYVSLLTVIESNFNDFAITHFKRIELLN